MLCARKNITPALVFTRQVLVSKITKLKTDPSKYGNDVDTIKNVFILNTIKTIVDKKVENWMATNYTTILIVKEIAKNNKMLIKNSTTFILIK